MRRLIGIVSGIGPFAGADVLTKVHIVSAQQYGAREDVEYPEITFINKGIPGVGVTATHNVAFKNGINAAVNRLEAQGANIIGIACNTAHMYHSDLVVKKNTIIINLLEKVAHEASLTPHHYILLCSRTTKEQALYDDHLLARSVNFSHTTDSQQSIVDEIIGAVMTNNIEKASALLDTLMTEVDPEWGVILGCTEIPVVLSASQTIQNFHTIDSNKVLAQSLAKEYYSH